MRCSGWRARTRRSMTRPTGGSTARQRRSRSSTTTCCSRSPEGEDEDADETDEDTASWSQAFWRESTLTSLLEMLLGFEINKDDWRTLLTGAKARLPEIIARRNDFFLQAYQGKRHEYDNLLTYFLYRHFMKALGDDAVQDKVQLALVSTAVIQLLDVYEWLARARSRTGRRSASARRTRARLSITRTIPSSLPRFPSLTKWNKTEHRGLGVCGVFVCGEAKGTRMGALWLISTFGRRSTLLHLSGCPCHYHRRVVAAKFTTSKYPVPVF